MLSGTPFPKSEPRPKKVATPIPKVSAKRKEQIEKGLYILKVGKPLKQITAKQAKNLAAYEKGKREKYEPDNRVCESCGRSDRGISCSHLVARSHSFELVSEPINHAQQCFVCSEATESGRFFELKNGLKLLERLWSGLGEAGKQRFRYVLNQWPQNKDLWKLSSFFDSEIH